MASSLVLPLDEIDLNYINVNFLESEYHNYAIKPLWRVKQSVECYRFQVCTDYKDESPQYKCHVCDLQVPVMFSEAHELSERHRICLDIMDIALERTRGHVRHKNDNTAVSYKSLTYFCNVCTKVVFIEHKYLHNTSKLHLAALEREKLLKTLLYLYANKDENTQTNVNIVETKQTKHEISSFKKINILNSEQVNVIKNNVEEESLKTEEETFNTEELTFSTEQNTEKYEFCNTVEHTDENEILKLNEFTDIKELKNFKGNVIFENKKDYYMNIVTQNGYEFKVFEGNYHGIIHIDNTPFCLVCLKSLPDLDTHILSDKHIENISKPIDANCIRLINKHFSHCIICNLWVEPMKHIEDAKHIAKLNEARDQTSLRNSVKESSDTESDRNSDLISNIDPTKTFCDVCKVIVPVDRLECHKTGMKHRMKLKQTESVNNYQIKIDNGQMQCKVCNDIIKDIDTHTSSEEHCEKYLLLLEENKLVMLSEDRFRCEVCNCVLIQSYELNHVNGRKHKLQLKQIKALPKEANSVTPQYYNHECGSTSVISGIKKPILNVQFKVSGTNNSGSGINTIDQLNNTTSQSIDIISGLNNPISRLSNPMSSSPNLISGSGSAKVSSGRNATTQLTNAIFGSIDLISGINKPISTLSNPTSSLQNSISGTSNSGSGSMKVSSGRNATTQLTNPIFGSIDLISGNSMESESSKIISDKLISGSTGTVSDSMNSYNSEKTESYEENRTMNNNLICKLCDEVIIDIETHSLTKDHCKKFVELLQVNKVKMLTDSRCQCTICNCYILKDNMIDHIEAMYHKRLLKKLNTFKNTFNRYLPRYTRKVLEDFNNNEPIEETEIGGTGYFCRSCKVKVLDLKQHTKTIDHVKNISEKIDNLDKKYVQINYQLKRMNENKLFCSVCAVTIPYNMNEMNKHLSNDIHLKKYEALMKTNRIVQSYDTYDCGYCKMRFDFFKEIDHINSSRHLKNKQIDLKKSKKPIKKKNTEKQDTDGMETEYIILLNVSYH